MKRLTLLVVAMISVLALTGCNKAHIPKPAASAPQMKVVATVYPVYEFVRQVGGEKVDVAMLVPAGAEPHDWEPSAKDIVKLKTAKAVFYHGAGFETWSGKLLSKENLGGVPVVEVSAGIPLKHREAEDGEHSHKGDQVHTDAIDPHVWLDPVLAQQEVRNIAAALNALDPANQDYYNANAQKYIEELEKLHQEYQTSFQNVKRRSFITNHAAFGYLAARYNLKQLAIMGLSPDAEPTPERMSKLVKLVKDNQIKYIFAETVVNSKVANTIARETGAGVLVLHPIDQLTEQEWGSGATYMSLMRANLTNLRKAAAE